MGVIYFLAQSGSRSLWYPTLLNPEYATAAVDKFCRFYRRDEWWSYWCTESGSVDGRVRADVVDELRQWHVGYDVDVCLRLTVNTCWTGRRRRSDAGLVTRADRRWTSTVRCVDVTVARFHVRRHSVLDVDQHVDFLILLINKITEVIRRITRSYNAMFQGAVSAEGSRPLRVGTHHPFAWPDDGPLTR